MGVHISGRDLTKNVLALLPPARFKTAPGAVRSLYLSGTSRKILTRSQGVWPVFGPG